MLDDARDKLILSMARALSVVLRSPQLASPAAVNAAGDLDDRRQRFEIEIEKANARAGITGKTRGF